MLIGLPTGREVGTEELISTYYTPYKIVSNPAVTAFSQHSYAPPARWTIRSARSPCVLLGRGLSVGCQSYQRE